MQGPVTRGRKPHHSRDVILDSFSGEQHLPQCPAVGLLIGNSNASQLRRGFPLQSNIESTVLGVLAPKNDFAHT